MYNLPMPSADEQLGAFYNRADKTVHFSLWAPTAFDVQVNLYKQHSDSTASFSIPAEYNRSNGIWSVRFNEVDSENYAYDYTVRTVRGVHSCLDPYAKSMVAYRNDGSAGRGVIIDMKSKKAGGSLVSSDFIPLARSVDVIIYEVSVRDFTSSTDAQTKTRGTYSAFIEKIPYILSLGVTHIQLLPVLNFYFTDELSQQYESDGTVRGNNYNWGYDPHSYFSPEGWYASNPADGYARVRELRELIDACHAVGLGVILDVVYNHMATTTFLDTIVPGYYFRTNEDGTLKNNSGCGNDTASEKPMMKRLIADSLEFWTREYKVDGFRFDLMGLMEYSVVIDSLARCRAINPHTLFIGEGWRMYNGPAGTEGMDQAKMSTTTGVSVFSDEFRDILKAGGMSEEGQGFITGQKKNLQLLFRNCMGDPQEYFKSRCADNVVNYVSCHDGLTLHDSISHNCRLADSNPKEKAEIISRIKLGNFFVLTSRGVAFLHAGQECGRTKPNICGWQEESIGRFVRNSYDSSDNINNFVWKLDSSYAQLVEYTKSLCNFRKQHAEFRSAESLTGFAVSDGQLLANLPKNGLVLGYLIQEFDKPEQKKGFFIVLVNASKKRQRFTLAIPVSQSSEIVKIGDAKDIKVVFDKNGHSETAGVFIHTSYDRKHNAPLVDVDPLSAVILYIQ
ncbi:MAG TPA: alpha-amylase family glycosyl hydrolase [Treponemataceae bacterium]|nr:alpha-amylase family glycosyl hydrolase [Treponemataceae bacterium]